MLNAVSLQRFQDVSHIPIHSPFVCPGDEIALKLARRLNSQPVLHAPANSEWVPSVRGLALRIRD
jgi:hypothetical protein